MNFLLIGLRPLRHYADFRGRSTRTELICFYVLTGLLGFVVNAVGLFAGAFAKPSAFGATDMITLALLCPTLALSVRRLHDSGRSGWWLLLMAAPAAVGLWDRYLLWQSPLAFLAQRLPWLIEVPTSLCGLAILILLLWNDEEGPNAYGPNPRYSDGLPHPDHSGEPA